MIIGIPTSAITVSIDLSGSSNIEKYAIDSSGSQISQLIKDISSILNDPYFQNEQNKPIYSNYTGDGVIICFPVSSTAALSFAVEINKIYQYLPYHNPTLEQKPQITIGIASW